MRKLFQYLKLRCNHNNEAKKDTALQYAVEALRNVLSDYNMPETDINAIVSLFKDAVGKKSSTGRRGFR